MTISDKDLFMAILSMDAYNRGYEPGFAIAGTQIGTATFTLGSDQQPAGILEGVNVGFYAAAYTTDYGTVISYRGTDLNFVTPWSDDQGSDMWNGYAAAAGDANAEQARLAAEFFQSVTNTQTSDPRTANITLTGHSQTERCFFGALAGRGGLFAEGMPR